ncbi:hypothetical protein ACFLZB_05055 [Nanoarchaeota archaeon]
MPLDYKMKNITKKEYSLGEVLSHAWHLFKKNFKLILFITLIIYIPINIILQLIPVDPIINEFGFWQGMRLYSRIMQILEGLIGIIAMMAIVHVIDMAVKNKKVGLGDAFIKALTSWPKAIWTNIVRSIFLIGLFVLLIVPGIIYSVYWYFFIFVVVIHGKYGNQALKHSKAVVKGRWWRIVGYAIVFGILSAIIGIAVALPFALFSGFTGDIITSIIGDTLIDIVASFFIVAFTIFFINLDHTKKIEPVKKPSSKKKKGSGMSKTSPKTPKKTKKKSKKTSKKKKKH